MVLVLCMINEFVSDYLLKKLVKVELLFDLKKFKMVELIFCFNVYDDEVFIDGVSFGVIKLIILLFVGFYEVEICKCGYKSYKVCIDFCKV